MYPTPKKFTKSGFGYTPAFPLLYFSFREKLLHSADCEGGETAAKFPLVRYVFFFLLVLLIFTFFVGTYSLLADVSRTHLFTRQLLNTFLTNTPNSEAHCDPRTNPLRGFDLFPFTFFWENSGSVPRRSDHPSPSPPTAFDRIFFRISTMTWISALFLWKKLFTTILLLRRGRANRR